jgi:hypothetical protein
LTQGTAHVSILVMVMVNIDVVFWGLSVLQSKTQNPPGAPGRALAALHPGQVPPPGCFFPIDVGSQFRSFSQTIS